MISSIRGPLPATLVLIVLTTVLGSCGSLTGNDSKPEVITISGSNEESKVEQASDTAGLDLAHKMATMHWFTQKLALSIDQNNRPLARYYLAKMRQTGRSIEQDLPRVEGYPVGDYLAAILEPELEGLRQRLHQEDNWKAVSDQYGHVIEACNNCHMGTGRQYLRVTEEVPDPNFSQSFVPGKH